MAKFGPIPIAPADRFWRHVRYGGTTSETIDCWEWTGARRNGYGVFAWSPTDLRIASRAAWELTYGPVPEGQQVLHLCDNRPCVRPNHLQVGSQSTNLRDAVAAGRLIPPPPGPRDEKTGRWVSQQNHR